MQNQETMPTKRLIKIAFCDPESVDNQEFAHFIYALKSRYNIDIVPLNEADYLLYSDFGLKHLDSKAVKIFHTGENHQADWTACDYALTHEYTDHPRHHRLPYFAVYPLHKELLDWDARYKRETWTSADIREKKTKFCNFIYRNHVCKTRNQFFKNLSSYKHIDSAGPFLNNMKNGECAPRGVENTLKFMDSYKFSISFENEAHRGYTTEKLFNALLARTVPIYWGNPDVALDFNPDSFINYYDFSSEKELIDYVIHVDENEELYLKYLNAPIFPASRSMEDIRSDVFSFFDRIFADPMRQRSASELRLFTLKNCIGRYAFARLKAWKRKYTKRR